MNIDKYQKKIRNVLIEVYQEGIDETDYDDYGNESEFHRVFRKGKREAVEEIAEMLGINLFRDLDDKENEQ